VIICIIIIGTILLLLNINNISLPSLGNSKPMKLFSVRHWPIKNKNYSLSPNRYQKKFPRLHKKDTKLVEDGRKIFSGFVDHKHPVTWNIFAFQKRMYKEDL